MRFWHLSQLCSFFFLGAALSGCGTVARVATEAVVREKQSSDSAATLSNYVASLAPFEASKVGPGLMIFEPRGPQNLQNFGAGCTRWLQFHVGGQGELGRTPSLRAYPMARQPLGLSDYRLNFDKAREAAKYGGATHFATSEIGPNALKIALYELASASAQKPAARFEIPGTPAQIVEKLPQFETLIAATLRVSQPKISSKVGASAQEMAILGAQPLRLEYQQVLEARTQQQLQEIARREPLAAALSARLTGFSSEAARDAFAVNAVKTAPEIPVLCAEMLLLSPALVRTHSAKIEALEKRFPHHLQLTTARASALFAEEEWQPALEASEKMVRISPKNLHAWWFLGENLGDVADAKRSARYASDIGLGEWGTLKDLYARQSAAYRHATTLAPRDALMWAGLAVAATFAGDDSQAQNALDTALKLDPKCGEAWRWGMQMTQPKWGGSVDEFKDFSTKAAAHSREFYFAGLDVASVLHEDNRWSEARPILEASMKVNPKNVDVLCELGQLLHHEHQIQPAEKLYRRALALDPNHIRTLNSLAEIEFHVHSNPKKGARIAAANLEKRPKSPKIARFREKSDRKIGGIKPQPNRNSRPAPTLGIENFGVFARNVGAGRLSLFGCGFIPPLRIYFTGGVVFPKWGFTSLIFSESGRL